MSLSLMVGLLEVGALAAMVHAADRSPTFGSINSRDRPRNAIPIAWESAAGMTVSAEILRFPGTGGVVKSEKLPLSPLRLYDITMTARRGPGTRNRFLIVFEDEQGVRHERQPVWQCLDVSRPNWFPLSPYRQQYLQSFILPPGTKDAWLELAVDAADKPELSPYVDWELFALQITGRQEVAFGNHFGANCLPEGDMEKTMADGRPVGWTIWGKPPEPMIQVVEDENGHQVTPGKHHFLRIHAGTGVLLATQGVPVERGTAWRISLWARGKGAIQMMGQVLDGDPSLSASMRVGDAQSKNCPVDSPNWTQQESIWFAESPYVKFGQVVLGINAAEDLDINDVQFQPYER